MTDLIDTTEMYLRTILELEEEGITPMRARIAERLDHSGPTVSQTVGRMERHGLVHLETDRSLALTDEGREKAISVMRKHRLAERLLADVVGLDIAHVHEEACRWEHVMSERVERRLVELLNSPKFSPYGNAIPGLETLGISSERDDPKTVTLFIAAQDAGVEDPFVLARFPEVVQKDVEFMYELSQAGIVPGAPVRIERRDDAVVLRAEGAERGVSIDLDTAWHIVVKRGS
ncbi:MarR family transcriptional regulator [Rothia sp. AR01]|uniref:MarR family transcriptional regulator n=1 Tax=Rothia santali TaxID=2949643 RepID=A0A9X2KI11_9MICC|nr:metal-dependent transcriptional regulator [Rothia santali]MCP3426412.1 MarR family transcriptional regulator [Rothia santali]